MPSKTKYRLATLATAGYMLLPGAALAQTDVLEDVCNLTPQAEVCAERNRQLFGDDSIFGNVMQTLIFLVGATSVLMIVVGGLRFVLSGGDANSTTAARSTIIHAVVGVVVAVSAQLILSFVLKRL